jgi:type IV secretion system protein TrbJ
MKKSIRNLLFLVLLTVFNPSVFATGIPVVDVVRNAIATAQVAAEDAIAVAQANEVVQTAAIVAKQILEYNNQLLQWENMVKNTAAPFVRVYDTVANAMNTFRRVSDTITGLKDRFSNMDGYLNKFKDLNYYRSSPCYRTGGCSNNEISIHNASQKELNLLGSELKKQSNDAWFKGLDNQQTALESDSQNLIRLQDASSRAEGRMQAISFQNQLASNQSHQLLQMRSLMIAQQNAEATRYQVELDEQARSRARAEHMTTSWLFTPSSTPTDFEY